MTDEARYLQTFDELHSLATENRSAMSEDEFIEWVESVLILAYRNGMEDTADMLDMAIDTTELPIADLDKALNLAIDGKTYRDRLHEYYLDGSDEEISRVVETEYHRMFNQGGYTEAVELGADYKEWITVGDNRVRDTHRYLEGVRVPISERFYTYDGDSALAPGGFNSASNNVGCRCLNKYIKGGRETT